MRERWGKIKSWSNYKAMENIMEIELWSQAYSITHQHTNTQINLFYQIAEYIP